MYWATASLQHETDTYLFKVGLSWNTASTTDRFSRPQTYLSFSASSLSISPLFGHLLRTNIVFRHDTSESCTATLHLYTAPLLHACLPCCPHSLHSLHWEQKDKLFTNSKLSHRHRRSHPCLPRRPLRATQHDHVATPLISVTFLFFY